MYSSYSSLIRWNEPNDAALLKVRSRMIIELMKNNSGDSVT